MNKEIVYIGTDKLFPHPQNPRKIVGDVTELSESIKAKGILQNLTVVHGGAGVPTGQDGYTVIIGHRRLAAAKQAKIDKLPCIVAEMTESEQQETMLLENMQRSDLTVVEQAQGFQLLLDMGHSQEEISEKTGFSKATVSKRLKIATLDKEKTKNAEERGGTLEDLVKIANIEDKKEQEKLLDQLGTYNFEWSYNRAVKQQKIAKLEPEIISELKSIAEPVTGQTWDQDHKVVFMLNDVDNYYPGIFKEKIESENNYQYTAEHGYYGLYLFKKSIKEKNAEDKKSEKEIMADEHRKQLYDLSKTAFEMRKNFIENYSALKSHESEIADFLTAGLMAVSDNYGFSINSIENILNVKGNEEIYSAFCEQYNNDRLRVQLEFAYAAFVDSENNTYVEYSFGKKFPPHKENKSLDLLYECLIDLGYEMSDVEKSLKNGTNELFSKE